MKSKNKSALTVSINLTAGINTIEFLQATDNGNGCTTYSTEENCDTIDSIVVEQT